MNESSLENYSQYPEESTKISPSPSSTYSENRIDFYKLKIKDQLNTLESLEFAIKHDLGVSPLIWSSIQFIFTLLLIIGLVILSLPITAFAILSGGLAIFLIMLSALWCYFSYSSVKMAYRKYRRARSYRIQAEAMSARAKGLLENIESILDRKNGEK